MDDILDKIAHIELDAQDGMVHDQYMGDVVEQLYKCKQVIRAFSKLTDNTERVRFIRRQRVIQRQFADIQTDYTGGKDATRAHENRVEGNEAFSDRHYEDAIARYTEAIRFAPELTYSVDDVEQQELPLAYGNRSAAFFHLEQFENALKDIEAALTLGFGRFKPLTKLMLRKVESLVQLDRFAEAKEALVTAKPDDLKCADGVRWRALDNQVKRKLLESTPKVSTDDDDKQSDYKYDKNSAIEYLRENGRFESQPKLASFSTSLAIRYDPQNGHRHLVTTEPVLFGEILAVTEPYAVVLSQAQELHFCHYCLEALDPKQPAKDHEPTIPVRSVPCSQCIRVLFCSEQCRDQAWRSYHRVECLMLPIFHQNNLNRDRLHHLPLRTFLISMNQTGGSLDKLRKVVDKFKSDEVSNSPTELVDPIDFEHIYSMRFTSSTMSLLDPVEDVNFMIGYAYMACYMVKFANKVSGFLKRKDRALAQEDDEVFASTIVLRNLLQIRAIKTSYIKSYAYYHDNEDTQEYLTLDPTICLLANSCDPNVSILPFNREGNEVDGNVMTLTANRFIPEGTKLGALLPSYGAIVRDISFRRFIKMNKQGMAQFNNECSCEPCELERRDNPFGAGTEDYRPIGCVECGGLIGRKSTSHPFGCLECHRPVSLGAMKKAYITLKKCDIQAKLLIDSIRPLLQHGSAQSYKANLEKLDSLFSEKMRPLLYQGSNRLVDMCELLCQFYGTYSLKSTNFAQNLLKSWNYAELCLTALERHYGDSMPVLDQLKFMFNLFEALIFNVDLAARFMKDMNNVDTALWDLIHRFERVKERMEKMCNSFEGI